MTGASSRVFWDSQAQVRQGIEHRIIRDGGYTTEDAPEALRLAAASIGQAAVVQQSAFARLIESGGPLTSRGRQRRAFVVWQAATDRLDRGLRLVGLRRMPKPALSPLDYINGKSDDL